MKMISRFFTSLTLLVLLGVYPYGATSHGAMTSPRPRNIHAFQNGRLGSYYEATALNNNIYQTNFRSNSVCGQIQNGGPDGMDYDKYSSGIQASFTSGQVISVNVEITAYHFGHFEFSICPAGISGTPTQDCFRNNKLTIVRDTMHNAPLDPNHPERAMLPPQSFGKNYAYEVALPNNLPNGHYVLKWMYVSGNSCVASGYNKYPFPSSWGPMYTNGLAICGEYDRVTPLAVPEIFLNCAEVTILGSGSAPITIPSRAPTPIASPVASPVIASSGSCGGGKIGNGICRDGSCCSKWGYCGCTTSHCIDGQRCGRVPTSRPLRPTPAPVPPSLISPTGSSSFCGGGNKGNGICRDGTCCSRWGYCGCTSGHCINGQRCGVAPSSRPITPPPIAPTSPPASSTGATCCSNRHTGLTAADNCDGFVHCVNGVNQGYNPCPTGLKFQQNGGFCDYADKVQCSSSCLRSV